MDKVNKFSSVKIHFLLIFCSIFCGNLAARSKGGTRHIIIGAGAGGSHHPMPVPFPVPVPVPHNVPVYVPVVKHIPVEVVHHFPIPIPVETHHHHHHHHASGVKKATALLQSLGDHDNHFNRMPASSLVDNKMLDMDSLGSEHFANSFYES